MTDVLFVGRPALGNENSTLSLFKIDPDGKGAVRVPVKVGRASVNSIQVLDGLKEGDAVILSGNREQGIGNTTAYYEERLEWLRTTR